MPRVIILSALAWLLGASGTVQSDPPSEPCSTVTACRAELVTAKRAVAWQRDMRRRAERRLTQRLARAHRPTVFEAANVAALVYHVSASEMMAVARCETGGTFDPRTVNRSSGATGAWQFLLSTWQHTPFAMFPRTDPWAQAMATANIVSREGWRQWVCQP